MNIFAWLKKVLIRKNVEDENNLSAFNMNVQYNNVESAIGLCERLNKLYKEKEDITPEYNQLIQNMSTIQEIETLPVQKLMEFENTVNTYCEALEQKSSVKNILKGKSVQSNIFEDEEEDIPSVIQTLKQYEDKQRLVRSDLNYLQGEKSDLTFQRERLLKAQKTIKGLTIAFASIFSIIALVLTMIMSVYNQDVVIPGVIALVVLVFLGMWLYIFRRYVQHELKKNVLLQKRAVELLNKTKIKYVGNEQYLLYIYKKYKVRSSEVLEYQWEKYQENMKAKRRITRISSHILAIEEAIEALVNTYHLGDARIVISKSSLFRNKKGRKELLSTLEEKKKILKKQLELLENDIHLISHLIVDLMEKDTTSNKGVTTAIERCLESMNIKFQIDLDKR